MDHNLYHEIEDKAQILVDSLPYIRDFNQKIIIISFGCSNILTDEEEQEVMRDIALMKSIGMRPIVVHDTKMGHDKFRENKRIAKMIEFCGVKAVGICGIDLQTIHMTLDNDYIPVIVPNDIDNEMEHIDPRDTALEVAVKMQADKLIRMALQEDITSEDVSTNAVMRSAVKGTVDLIAKEDGIIAGLDVYARVFQILDEKTEISFNFKDGDAVKKGDLLGTVTGDIRVLLSGERVALNYLQRMSGIATYTKQVSKLLEGSKVTLLDTRKTTPNCRVFEKYAVRIGGGCNHRYNLSDGVLLKDNHIGAAGSVAKAVAMAKEYAPFVRKIEIEVETMEQVKEAVEAGADIIMLDNMTPEMMKEAVELIAGRAQTECSGNITKENIAKILETGVDFVSSGALTHSAPILDISMKNLHAI